MSASEFEWVGGDTPVVHEMEPYQTADGEFVVGEINKPSAWMLTEDFVEVRQ